MKKQLFFLIALASPTLSAQTIFHCITEKGNTLKVEKINNTYEYSHGPKTKPSLVITKEAHQLEKNNDHYGFSAGFRKGAYLYDVYMEQVYSERYMNWSTQFGVKVFKNNKLISNVKCGNKGETFAIPNQLPY